MLDNICNRIAHGRPGGECIDRTVPGAKTLVVLPRGPVTKSTCLSPIFFETSLRNIFGSDMACAGRMCREFPLTPLAATTIDAIISAVKHLLKSIKEKTSHRKSNRIY